MELRTARTQEIGPAIEVELIAVERLAATLPARSRADGLGAGVARLRRRHAVVIGTHRGIDPRRQSVVEHRVRGAAVDVARRVASGAEAIRFPGGGLVATAPAEFAYDPVEHEYRLSAGMHVTWAWPDLPVWLAVAELSGSNCVLRLSLRSRRRLRYPVRYFHAAHCALSEIEHRVDAGAP